MLTAGAALSEHPDAAHATGEVVGRVLELVGPAPGLAVLGVAGHHRGAVGDIAAAVRAALAPGTLLGAAAAGVVGGDREVDGHPAVSLWAAGGDGLGDVVPVALAAAVDERQVTERQVTVLGVDDDQLAAAGALVVLADPDRFPVAAVLAHLADRHPHLPVAGTVLGAAGGDPPALVLDAAIGATGAVAVLLGPAAGARCVLAQGCRPVGPAYVVTAADGAGLVELAGRPAATRLAEIVAALPERDRPVTGAPLLVGVALDEHRVEHGPGDFAVHEVAGTDPARGTVWLPVPVPVGATVRLHVRDGAGAAAELATLLAGEAATSALLLGTVDRGRRLFGGPDHDAGAVARATTSGAVGGLLGTAAIGPLGGRPACRPQAAAIVLLG